MLTVNAIALPFYGFTLYRQGFLWWKTHKNQHLQETSSFFVIVGILFIHNKLSYSYNFQSYWNLLQSEYSKSILLAYFYLVLARKHTSMDACMNIVPKHFFLFALQKVLWSAIHTIKSVMIILHELFDGRVYFSVFPTNIFGISTTRTLYMNHPKS